MCVSGGGDDERLSASGNNGGDRRLRSNLRVVRVFFPYLTFCDWLCDCQSNCNLSYKFSTDMRVHIQSKIHFQLINYHNEN